MTFSNLIFGFTTTSSIVPFSLVGGRASAWTVRRTEKECFFHQQYYLMRNKIKKSKLATRAKGSKKEVATSKHRVCVVCCNVQFRLLFNPVIEHPRANQSHQKRQETFKIPSLSALDPRPSTHQNKNTSCKFHSFISTINYKYHYHMSPSNIYTFPLHNKTVMQK